VTIDDPRVPRVALLEPDDGTALATGSNIVLLAEAGDPDGEIRTVTLQVDGQAVAEATGSTVQLLWTPPSTGLYEVVAVARDDLRRPARHVHAGPHPRHGPVSPPASGRVPPLALQHVKNYC
jgi:hypothetical protein